MGLSLPHHRALTSPSGRGAQPYAELRQHYDAIYDLLLDGRPAREASPILDIGSGDGAALEAVTAGAPIRAVALDRPPAPRWNGPDDAIRALGDAHRLPFADEAFGAALLIDTFEWLRHPAAALREAARVARGPVVVVQTDWPALWFDSDDPELARELVRRWSAGAPEPLPAALRDAASEAGLAAESSAAAIRASSLAPGSLAYDQLRAMRRWLVVERPQVRASRFDAWRRKLDRRAASGHFEMLIRRRICVLRSGGGR